MTTKQCFDPVVNSSTRLLILGSLPSEESLLRGEYYGNRRNAFWHLMSQVLDVDLVNLQYQSRLNVLLEHRVGLWDVIADAVREGSLDSKIRQHQGNDLATFVAENPSITTIAFNGKTASKLGRKQIAPILHQIKIFDLPSSSPAHTMSVEKKIKSWILLRSRLSGAI